VSCFGISRPWKNWVTACRSFRITSFPMSWFPHWLSMFLSTIEGRWVQTMSPTPRFLPLLAISLKIATLSPFCGTNLSASSTMIRYGVLLFSTSL